MQSYPYLNHDQLSEHLQALRQEAARSRLVSSQPGLLRRVFRLFNRQAQPGQLKAGKPGIRTT